MIGKRQGARYPPGAARPFAELAARNVALLHSSPQMGLLKTFQFVRRDSPAAADAEGADAA